MEYSDADKSEEQIAGHEEFSVTSSQSDSNQRGDLGLWTNKILRKELPAFRE